MHNLKSDLKLLNDIMSS